MPYPTPVHMVTEPPGGPVTHVPSVGAAGRAHRGGP